MKSLYAVTTAWDWGSVPDWVVALTAMFGVIAGLYQLRSIRKANDSGEDANRLERFKILMDLDREYEDPRLRSSRQRLFSVARGLAKARAGDVAGPLDLSSTATEQVSKYMDGLWGKAKVTSATVHEMNDPGEEYLEIMRFPYWLETVGFCCKLGLLREADFLKLYDVAIINVMSQIMDHIEARREAGGNGDFLENAVWLFEAAKAQRGADVRSA